MQGEDGSRKAVKTEAVASSADVDAWKASCEDLGAWGEMGEGGYVFSYPNTGKVFFEDLCVRRGIWEKRGSFIYQAKQHFVTIEWV
jgi:hypothetical protein